MEEDLVIHEFDAYAAGNRYAVRYFDLAENNVKGKNPFGVLQAFVTGYRPNSKMEDEKELSLGKDKVPAREYRVSTSAKDNARERVVLSGTRLYVIILSTAGDKDDLYSPDSVTFFDSFEFEK